MQFFTIKLHYIGVNFAGSKTQSKTMKNKYIAFLILSCFAGIVSAQHYRMDSVYMGPSYKYQIYYNIGTMKKDSAVYWR